MQALNVSAKAQRTTVRSIRSTPISRGRDSCWSYVPGSPQRKRLEEIKTYASLAGLVENDNLVKFLARCDPFILDHDTTWMTMFLLPSWYSHAHFLPFSASTGSFFATGPPNFLAAALE